MLSKGGGEGGVFIVIILFCVDPDFVEVLTVQKYLMKKKKDY